MHGHSMVSVYRCIDMSLLPEEYLPDDYEGDHAGSIPDITGECARIQACDISLTSFLKGLIKNILYGA